MMRTLLWRKILQERFTNGQIFLAPITLYHFDPITPNYIVNANCWDIGTVTAVTYFEPISSCYARLSRPTFSKRNTYRRTA
jgi:hypothetical protein